MNKKEIMAINEDCKTKNFKLWEDYHEFCKKSGLKKNSLITLKTFNAICRDRQEKTEQLAKATGYKIID